MAEPCKTCGHLPVAALHSMTVWLTVLVVLAGLLGSYQFVAGV
jgi:hypothetical protein